MTTNTITDISLNKLVPFAGNVRKTKNKTFIEELTASIRAHGLQQNLIVKKEGKKFAVVAGSQRFAALLKLLKAEEIKSTHPVPCLITEGDIDPIEISLLENAVREDMHPADLFEAFRDLVDKGASVADIAARFGRSEQGIRQLLKLARVNPVLLKSYRKGDLNLDQVMAFAVSDDHEAQAHVFANLSPHDRSARTIREALTCDQIAASDKRGKFVTRKAYEKAGGGVQADLFTEGEDGVFILDIALLERLVAEKLQRVAKSISGEGWKWTEAYADLGYDQKSQFRRIYAEAAPLSSVLAAEAQELQARCDTLRDEWYASEDEDAPEPEEISKIEARLEEIEATRGEPVWAPEQLAIAGAIVTIDRDGKAELLRGLVKPEDMPKKQKTNRNSAEGNAAQPMSLSAALVEDLTAQRSAALAAALSQRPDVALAAMVHALASRVLLKASTEATSLKVTASAQSFHRVEGSKALVQLEALREEWSRELPATPDDLWEWCLEQKQGVLLKLLAFSLASTVDAVQTKGESADGARLQHADKLASAVGLDMKEWFTPDAKNYFGRVNKPQLLSALQEANGKPTAPSVEKLKKSKLAALAERETEGKGWLPSILRSVA